MPKNEQTAAAARVLEDYLLGWPMEQPVDFDTAYIWAEAVVEEYIKVNLEMLR